MVRDTEREPLVCPVCHTANEYDANFCLNCGHRLSLLCPRCGRRVVSHANFCDACGLDLATREPGEAVSDERQRPLSRPVESRPPASPLQPTPPPAEIEEVNAPPESPLPADGEQPVEPGDSPLAQYIPRELMRKLEAARAGGAMVGERRIVTMLFCDIENSTAAAELLDPEEWSEIVNGAFEHMIKPVYTYEGTVARLMGDSILAFFGAPLAHEDDPHRAVLAGLDMIASIVPYREMIKKNWGIDFNLRVGINTGLVVVGAVGSDLRMEYTALGDAINLASRMEQTAEPGTVRISHDTYRLVKPLFDFKELGGIEVKGKQEPVLAYQVIGRKVAAARVRGIEGLHAELVGREVEMQTLQRVITDLQQGVGRIVCVLGEAGLGKSRLVSEARQFFEQLPDFDGDWFETTSLSYETNQAYGLFQRLIRRVSGIGYDDAPLMMRKKLTALADTLPEERRPRAAQLFEALFGLSNDSSAPPLEGDTFKEEMYEAMDAWWRVRFSERPTVLVFDDMHWSDAASIDLLRRLLPLSAEVGLVLICAMRAERRSPAWQIKTIADEEYHHRYTEASLRPLSESESNELINRLLAIPQIPDQLRNNILAKSDGNPFFIEEVVRTLIDNGVVVPEDRLVDGRAQRYWVATSDGSDFSVPDNLRALLAARMDRLEEETRATLQLASVIGRSFYLRVLQAVNQSSPELDSQVSTLLRLDLIRESARVPELEYSFRNPLTQEAVYKTILLKRRREFHLQVGEAIENIYRDRLEGLYGLLAHHFTLALENERAIYYRREASRQAAGVYAYDEAEQNLRQALELVDGQTPPEVHMTLLEELGDIFRRVRDFTQAISFYRQALSIQESLSDGDDLTFVRLHRKIVEIATDTKWSVDAETYDRISQLSRESQSCLEESVGELEERTPHEETVHSLAALSADAWRVQAPPNWEAAERFAREATELAERLDDVMLLSQALGALANVLDGRSRLRDHLQVAQRRLEVTQDPRFDDKREEIDALRGLGVALMYVGEYEEALPHLDRAAELATRIHAADQVANALGIRAQCLFRLDRWDDVLETEVAWRALEQNYSRERIGETCFFVALSASIFALRGETTQANVYAKESYDYMVSMSGLPDQWQRNQFY